MPKLVCPECKCEYRPKENGVIVIEYASFGPYKVWFADLWRCPGCDKTTVAGFPEMPLREDHYSEGFREWLDTLCEQAKKNGTSIIEDYERPNRA